MATIKVEGHNLEELPHKRLLCRVRGSQRSDCDFLFGDMTSCSLVDRYRYFRGNTFLQNVSNDLHDKAWQTLIIATMRTSDLTM
jgi:hypothetical protein